MASLIQIGIASTHSNNAKRNRRYPIMDSMLYNGRIFRLALALIYMSLICCASHGEVKVKPTSERELLTGKKSIFLFRLSIDIDGKSMDMYQELNQNRIHISIANIDTEGSIEHLATVYSPSTEMSKNGWFYLLVDPAAYYMKISLLWQPKISPVIFLSQATHGLSMEDHFYSLVTADWQKVSNAQIFRFPMKPLRLN
jgi:hypothetical protein